MATPIEQDAYTVLEFAIKRQDEARAADVDQVTEEFDGDDIKDATGLPPERINDAVALLRQNGFLDGYDFLGTAPFDFGTLHATPFGRYELQRLSSGAGEEGRPDRAPSIDRLPVPVGSPFGFTDIDWEHVSSERGRSGRLRVVLGYQFESEHYDSVALVANLRAHFEAALTMYNDHSVVDAPVTLVFEPLSAGLGEHLFNEIVRAIISSDVAVFETSDLNPNVMIEMGVALTWGTVCCRSRNMSGRDLHLISPDRPGRIIETVQPTLSMPSSGRSWSPSSSEHTARSSQSPRPSLTESTSPRSWGDS